MKSREKVSIVIPVYNAEKYLRECINSLINQDYENIEIILVDDGSKDSSPNICDEYANKDKRIKVIHKENGGVSSARNAGIDASAGEWITFVDADDMVDNNYVSYLIELAVKNDSSISLTTYPKKFTQFEKENNFTNEEKIITISGKDAAKMMLYYKIVISSWNKMFNKKFLEKNKLLFEKDLSYGEGFEFVIHSMINANKVTISNKKIYNYRVDNNCSAMTVFKEKLVTGSIDSQNRIKERIINKYSNKVELAEMLEAWNYSNWHTHCDCLNTIYGSKANKSNRKMMKQISKVCKKEAKVVFNKNVPKKDKIKGILYLLSPRLASSLINKMRMRKFTNIKG